MRGRSNIWTIGAIAIAVLFAFSLLRLGQKLASGSFVAMQPLPTGGASATLGADGIQRMTLSFAQSNYTPDTIRVRRGIPVELTADLNRLRGCFSTFTIPQLNVWKQFTAAENTIAFTPNQVGTYRFSCAMGMGAGRLIVEG